MASDEVTPATATKEGATATATTTAPVEKTTTDVSLGPDGKPWDPERAGETIAQLREFEKQAKELARRNTELEASNKAHEEAKLSETEKLSKHNSELEQKNLVLEQQLQQSRVGTALRDAASKAGARYPETVVKLVDFAGLSFDEEGHPKDVDKVIETIAKSYPEYFTGGAGAPGKVAAGARGGAGTEQSMDDWIRQQANVQRGRA
jgi:Phage minor structural protein GP20